MKLRKPCGSRTPRTKQTADTAAPHQKSSDQQSAQPLGAALASPDVAREQTPGAAISPDRLLTPPGINRRDFLARTGGVLGGVALAAGLPAGAALLRAPVAPLSSGRVGYPFTLGVASGDPRPEAVVIWTRLAPKPHEPGGGMLAQAVLVRWEVAADERFHRIVRHGWKLARPEYAHSVHVHVGGLHPARHYWYRFIVAGEESAIGRTRTAPDHFAPVDRLRFAFVSCQNYVDGFYTAYQHLAEEDLDLVVFLGDYIYEDAPDPGAETVRQHTGEGEPVTLEEYRIRYALYRADPLLQAAHAAFPWIVTFDDHEVDNDWSADIPQDPDEQPRGAFLRRRAAAFQAYWEHMPLRMRNRPEGPDMSIFRRLKFGDVLEFNVLDTRQFRSVTEPCEEDTGPACAAVFDPARTMLGDRQERWLLRGLDHSQARWNVLAQQVPMMRIEVAPGPEKHFKLDKWDAYPVARERIFQFLAERRPSNPVVITGDLHDNWVGHLKADFDRPDSPVLGTEFIGTSISSDGDGAERSEEGEIALQENPHILFHNYRRGYVRCEVTQAQWRTDFRTLPYVSRPGAPISTRASFVLEDGNPAAEKA